MREMDVNPIIKSDFPDVDVIRVEDTYYMLSTTMHFLPGGALLKSYDLINWEMVNYLFETLDDFPGELLSMESTNYGAGMWAPSLRYHEGKFYAVFVSKNAGKTYVFTATDPLGKWDRHDLKGFFHDCSLLFDDDGRKYLVSGNTDIRLVELNDDLTDIKEGGIDKIIVSDVRGMGLGYEGSHFYKINGKYYLFLIHWLSSGNGRRTEACFVSDTVDGEYVGGDCLDDDMGFFNQGVAQGGIVDTPAGKWYGVLFRDNGAVGRIPVIVPVTFEGDMPVFGINGKVPKNVSIASSRPYYRYDSIYTSDFFDKNDASGERKLKLQWQWNHRPDNKLWNFTEDGGLRIKTDKICANLTHAKNTLTQRCMYPKCEAEVSVDASDIKDGDVAGICILQGAYGLIGITKEAGQYYLVRIERNLEDLKPGGDYLPGTISEKIRIQSPKVSLCLKATFEDMQDKLDFFYEKDRKWVKVGPAHRMAFRLDHFCGARFGLFVYSTKESGGSAIFNDFKYEYV